MSVKYTNNTPKVRMQESAKVSRFLRAFAGEAGRSSEPRTPKKHGDLRRSWVASVNGFHGRVVWLKKYAAIQETKQFKNYTTPGTGPHFARGAMEKALKKQKSLFRQA